MPCFAESRTKEKNGKTALLVVGIGSPHGADSVAWRAVDLLAREGERGATFIHVAEPLDFLSELPGQRWLIVVDACRCGLPEEAVRRLAWPEDRLDMPETTSTHRLGMASALELADTLGLLPQQTTLLLIEIGQQPADPSSAPASDSAVQKLADAVIREIEEHRHA